MPDFRKTLSKTERQNPMFYFHFDFTHQNP